MAEKSKRGFASMDREKQRLIASKGGKAAHEKGTAHEFTSEEARAAGRKGGQAAHRRGTAHQFTPEEAREAGRKGGQGNHASSTPASMPPPLPAVEERSTFADGSDQSAQTVCESCPTYAVPSPQNSIGVAPGGRPH